MRDRAEVWRAAAHEQDNGETVYEYAFQRTVWAAVTPTSGRAESLEGGATRAELTHRVVVREASLPDICREMYLSCAGCGSMFRTGCRSTAGAAGWRSSARRTRARRRPMARDGFTCSEIYAFADALGTRTRETTKKVRQAAARPRHEAAPKDGAEGARKVRKQAVHRKGVERAAGTYHKSIKRGKLYYRGKAVCIRVYSSDPVAHLHEYGWRVKKRDKRTGKLDGGQEGVRLGARRVRADLRGGS
ncbi:MAG: head-tail adaptor protein [Butyricicoccaceae bacterium]